MSVIGTIIPGKNQINPGETRKRQGKEKNLK
jgi:hypothetical protein